MILEPADLSELSQQITGCFRQATKIHEVRLQKLDRILAYAPEDMTVTVETGISLDALQQRLKTHGQWLPLDPPRSRKSSTVGAIIDHNLSGPRRYGYGTIREHLLGLRVVMADGRIVRSGGQVVKNVAGYDLAKLFVGGQGSLGVIVEATFKLRPLPQQETIMQIRLPALAALDGALAQIEESQLLPVVLDVHNLPDEGYSLRSQPGKFALVVGFAGTEDEVSWQRAELEKQMPFKSSTLEYEQRFWSQEEAVNRMAILPSALTEKLKHSQDALIVARAGNGIIFSYGPQEPDRSNKGLPSGLFQRVKDLFDPNHTFPDLSW